MNPGRLVLPVRVAIIPARGASKGLLRKNLAKVAGVSLVGRAVRTARQASLFDRVVVSSDDSAILDEAQRHGADTHRRSSATSSDTASSEAALLEALDDLEVPDEALVVFLQCTSPFTRPTDLGGLVARVEGDGCDSAFTATPFHGFLWKPGPDAAPVDHPRDRRPRRQEREPRLLENGMAYAFRAGGLRRHGYRFHGRVGSWEVPASRSIEIDSPEDLAAARQLASLVALEETVPAETYKAVVFDFDGVLTDNRLWVDGDGREQVACCRSDGHALGRLRAQGMGLLILTQERDPSVQARAKKLGVEVVVAQDKLPALQEWCTKQGWALSQTVYVGNDSPDLPCMAAAGLAVAVADAQPEALQAADLVLTTRGGHGAARELLRRLRFQGGS